ncbi:MAG: Holliday junction resolvase RuvX [Cyclobacteriaceae bacterium]|nr:Holliday junction resolvase RuvX [Cyclobacteriaceae bacterium]
MSRILAIDLGLKRTGLAVTDPLQIIATALDTVETVQLIPYLQAYTARETVERFVLGFPIRLNSQDNEMTPHVRDLEEKLKKIFPTVPISLVDERFTSSMAKAAMIAGGMKKKDRREKGNVDKISAVLILQSYMDSKK